ncbi:MAG: hypothetical protein ACE5JI_19340 [Acidobacteriota bacterium]
MKKIREGKEMGSKGNHRRGSAAALADQPSETVELMPAELRRSGTEGLRTMAWTPRQGEQ